MNGLISKATATKHKHWLNIGTEQASFMSFIAFFRHHLGNVTNHNRFLISNFNCKAADKTRLLDYRICWSRYLQSEPTLSKTSLYYHSSGGGKKVVQLSTLLHSRNHRHAAIQANISRPNTSQTRSMSTKDNSTEIKNKNNDRDHGPGKEESILRQKYEPREIRFDTSYGHIACLEWGHRDAPHKILCVHGWLDNAGSFERLVPFILNHNDNDKLYHIVAMDMPGVGYSSHRPRGSDYTTFSNVIEMRRVTTQLGWNDDLTLLSHSLGAHFSYLYSCIYPRQVRNFISIDVVRPITFQVDNWNVTIANSIENYFRAEYNHQDEPKTDSVVQVYTEAEALQRLMEAHSSSLNYESAKTLMKRGARESRGGYTFNRDVRHRHLSVEFRPDDELMMKYLNRSFSPNLFIIRSAKSPFRMPEEVRLKYYEIYKRNCAIFRDILMDGTHHVHMNEPDKTAREIIEFLDHVRSEQLKKAAENCDAGNGYNLGDGSPKKMPPPHIGKPNL